jgi:hypothetical protein
VLGDRIRIYYATRYYGADSLPISQTSFIDVSRSDPREILHVHQTPSLELGAPESFSHYGIHPTMLVKQGGRVTFFYQGWNRCTAHPYETTIGIATSDDDGLTFTKMSEEPVLGLSPEDPLFVNGVFIMAEGARFRMWYSSGTEWIDHGGKEEAVYIIKSAVSNDLLSWNRSAHGCIPQKFADECQNSATVIRIRGTYHMWFCYRQALDFRNETRGYRIGYAWSDDLLTWNRDDSLAGITVASESAWDSQMVCYPYVFEVDGKILMLYSGNYFGKDGFGYAELIDVD